MLSMALFSIEIATLTLSLILGIYYNDDIDNANDVDNLCKSLYCIACLT
jgi:hypothetical protein